jgi:hypothetical protein
MSRAATPLSPPLDQTALCGWWRCSVEAVPRITDMDSGRKQGGHHLGRAGAPHLDQNGLIFGEHIGL